MYREYSERENNGRYRDLLNNWSTVARYPNTLCGRNDLSSQRAGSRRWNFAISEMGVKLCLAIKKRTTVAALGTFSAGI